MATLDVRDDRLIVDLTGWERIAALSGGVDVPLSSIREVARVDDALCEVRGIRAPGTGVPGAFALGRWRRRGGTDFVAARRNRPGYVITLEGERFARLVVAAPAIPELDERSER